MQTPRSSTTTLIDAMLILARAIKTSDGVANAAIYEAARRLQEQQDLLRQCQPYVSAQHDAEHMLDGFKPKPRPGIDQLLRRVHHENHSPFGCIPIRDAAVGLRHHLCGDRSGLSVGGAVMPTD